ncbi:MAG: TIGR02281 family clan AA aspartic protease [Hyphomicrobiaceae bacterium]
MVVWLILLLAALVVAFLVLSGNAELAEVLAETDIAAYAGAGILSLYVLFLLSGHAGRIGQALKHLSIWAALTLCLVVGYSYRDDVSRIAARVAGDLMPPGTVIEMEPGAEGERAVRIRKRRDSHFVARTTVNDASVSMLVDTGASTVVLTPADAQRAGVPVDELSYTVAVNTANGVAYAAPVRLRRIAIGPIEVRNVEALVAKPGGLSESLLGMSFLRRLRSFDFSGEYLTLRG